MDNESNAPSPSVPSKLWRVVNVPPGSNLTTVPQPGGKPRLWMCCKQRRPAFGRFRRRNLEEIMAERNLAVDHTTVWRWVQRYAPELNRRVRRELRPTGGSWRVDETYIRVAGRWTYLYRAVDSAGATIDFY